MSERGIHHVLAPVDLGASSTPALRYARMLAEQFGASITVLYVDQAFALQTYDDLVAGIRYLSHEEAAILNEDVRGFADVALGGVHYRITVAADDPAHAIVDAAENLDVDLVVMGTHARHGWDHVLEGSVAESVMRGCRREVLIVPQHAAADRRIARVLCPVNLSPVGRDAAREACRIAKAFDAELILVHVVDPARPSSGADEARFRAWADDPATHCTFREIILHGNAADQVLDCADDVDADLVVVGSQHRRHHQTESVIGTTTERLVQRSPRPILTVVRQVEAGVHEEREVEQLVDA